MPTLRWIRRPKSSASAASVDSSVTSGRSAEAVPDTVVFSSVVPAVSSKQSAAARSHAEILVDFQRLIEQARPDGGQKRKRTTSPSAKAAMAAEKKCKATSKRDLPTGVYKLPSATSRFVSKIQWGGTNRYIGTYATPEQASAAYLLVKKDLVEGANLSTADDVNAVHVFGAAQKKAAEAVGGFIPRKIFERELPRGVWKTPSGKFNARLWWGKSCGIGTFDTPEQASAAFISVKKDRDEAKASKLGVDEVDAAFDAARKRAVKAVGGVFNPRKKRAKTISDRDLPTGVQKMPSGKFHARIQWGGKSRCIGTFDAPEQAFAAHMSVRKDLGDIELSALGADEIYAAFDAVKKRALESVGGFMPRKRAEATSERDLPKGVQKSQSGKQFQSRIQWGSKSRYIGTFDTTEQASAAHMSVKKDLDNAELSTLGADEVNALFDAAKKKALEAVGGFMPRKRARTSERDLPTGVRKLPSGRFQAKIHFGGKNRGIGTFDTATEKKSKGTPERDLPLGVYKAPNGKFVSVIWWGGKQRHIGTFDTPEQASAVYTSMRNVMNDVELSALGADELTALFDATKKKAVETVGALSLLFSTRLIQTGAQ